MPKMTAIITLRLPQNNKLLWQENAYQEGLNLGDWIRKTIDGNHAFVTKRSTPKKADKIKYQKADPDLIRGISRIGSNLNQVARWCNTYKQQADVQEVLIQLYSLEKQVGELRHAYKTS